MKFSWCFIVNLLLIYCSCEVTNSNLPTLYELYTEGGIKSGLSDQQPNFRLNDKPFQILSGEIHYFRLHPMYYRDRLRKLRAMGCNTVQTYIPWNLHEYLPGMFDFGNGTSDFNEFVDVEYFLQTAKEEDLFVIVRPGPFIGAEWDLGGIPSWIQRDTSLEIRTTDEKFMFYVERYFNVLFPILNKYQFTNSGPIIAAQIENEYAYTDKRYDPKYSKAINDLFVKFGFVELLFQNSPLQFGGKDDALPDVLQTTGFLSYSEWNIKVLQDNQPNKPVYVSELWGGWFDMAFHKHIKIHEGQFFDSLEYILQINASVNFYMFYGGSNFGFMNGMVIRPIYPIDSNYDFHALLDQTGMYTKQYFHAKNMILKYCPPNTRLPSMPPVSKTFKPNAVTAKQQLTLFETPVPWSTEKEHVLPMELLNITIDPTDERNVAGQRYGYILYRFKSVNITSNSVLLFNGRIQDLALVILNGALKSKPFRSIPELYRSNTWLVRNSTFHLKNESFEDATLDILVENLGRKDNAELKGLSKAPILDGKPLGKVEIVPYEFRTEWIKSLRGWHAVNQENIPSLYKFDVFVENPKDTFIDFSNWGMGIIIVNNFVLGRYSSFGPTKCLYWPAPLMNKGHNVVVIFEHYVVPQNLTFQSQQIYITH